jgi:NOL1/NOP2/fmu family ribosome biogenesis protein
MCAAPGGKSGQAAAAIGDEGFLLSNEFVPKRAKIMVGNFERLGIKNAFVTSLDTGEFKKMYRSFFDFVIADVPCSGEGMFRKNEIAISEWSEENVMRCAERSREIIENAASVVAPGGYIIYSTCTFSIDENEAVVLDFLKSHDDFELAEVKKELRAVTADGVSIDGDTDGILQRCRRFYPHVSRGEGQFVALIRRRESDDMPTILYKNKAKEPDKSEKALIEAFLKDTLEAPIDAKAYKVGENVVLISHGVPVPEKSVFSSGVLLGEIRKGLLTPHHQFFSAYGKQFKRKLELSSSEEKTRKYLRGEEIENDGRGGGWCAVTYLGAPIGGGKAVGDRIKNHYPKGLRNK